MKIDKTNVEIPLTKAELDLLMTKQMPNERLERARDVWCFCAQTGLAFTDAEYLRTEQWNRNKNNIITGITYVKTYCK